MTFTEFNVWCTNQNVLTAADFSGSMHPDYKLALYAQAVHETGNFTSSVYKKHYNAFGMKLSMKRKPLWLPPVDGFSWMGMKFYAQTVQSWRIAVQQLINKYGEKARPYAQYGDSAFLKEDLSAPYAEPYLTLADRLNWDVYNGIVFQDIDQYISEVVSVGYAEDGSYRTKWMRLIEKSIKDNFVGPSQEGVIKGPSYAILLPLALWLMFKA